MKKERQITINPYYVIIGLCVLFFHGIFRQGYMSGWDNSFHFFDLYYLVNVLIPKFKSLSGFSLQSMAGAPILVDYYQTGFILMAFLNKILFLPLNICYKSVVFLSYMVFSLGFYTLTKERFGRTAGLVATLCLMMQKDIYIDGILAGMWSNYMALGAFCYFLHIIDRDIYKFTWNRVIIGGLLLSFVMLTHIYAAVFACIFLLIYIFPYLGDYREKRLTKKEILKYPVVLVIACLISAYYLYGFIVSRGFFRDMLFKDISTGILWSIKAFFGPYEETRDIVSMIALNTPVLIRVMFFFSGLICFMREKDLRIRRFIGPVLLFVLTAIVLFSDILPNIFVWWHNIPFIGKMQSSRFLIYAQVGMYIISAYGLSKALRTNSQVRTALTIVLGVFLFGSALFHYNMLAKDATKTLEHSKNIGYVREVWKWIRVNLSDKDLRVVYQNTVGSMDDDDVLKRSDVFALSGIFTGVYQIGVQRSASPFPQEDHMRNDHHSIFSRPVGDVKDGYIAGIMKKYNAGYIVTVEPELRQKLYYSRLFKLEKDFGPFSIFRLAGFSGAWVSFKKNSPYAIKRFDDHNIELKIDNKFSDNILYLNVAYHPMWRAQIGARTVKIVPDEYNLMTVHLRGKGSQRLIFSFNSQNYPLIVVSLASLLASLFMVILTAKTSNKIRL